MGGDPNLERLTQRRMTDYLAQLVAQAEQDEANDNEVDPLVQQYRNMNQDQQEAFSQGLEMGDNNADDPTQNHEEDLE